MMVRTRYSQLLVVLVVLACAALVGAGCGSSKKSSHSSKKSSGSPSAAAPAGAGQPPVSATVPNTASALSSAALTTGLDAIPGLDGKAKLDVATGGGHLSSVTMHIGIGSGQDPKATCGSVKAALLVVSATPDRGWTLKVVDPDGAPFGTLDCKSRSVAVPAAGVAVTAAFVKQVTAVATAQ
jgi:hypothetical protein